MSKTIEIITNSPKETSAIAESLGKLLKGGEKIALSGNLGSGKTTFVRGVARGLGIKNKITSPTFVLVNRHQFKKRPPKFLYHLDLYRLSDPMEFGELGLEEVIRDKKNVVVIEWAELAQKILPEGTLMIELAIPKNGGPKQRRLKIWSKK